MNLLQYTQYTTDRHLADKIMNSSSKSPGYTGGRLIPQGSGWKIILFFKLDKLDVPDGSVRSFPDGARLVFLPKCLYSVYGVTI